DDPRGFEVRDIDRDAVLSRPIAVGTGEIARPELRLADRRERPRRIDVEHMAVDDWGGLAQVELQPVHPTRDERAQTFETWIEANALGGEQPARPLHRHGQNEPVREHSLAPVTMAH